MALAVSPPAPREVPRRFLDFIREPLVPVPDDRALARARVYEDEGYLISRALDDLGA